ncbi:MAG: hypothetical protein M1836_006982 [Candelina mexicana]|nr:MAG: hypothetical protein M1836_006982 [Candelina mexicana]
MASWAYNPPPPHRLLSLTRISPSDALTHLQNYISTITDTPSLQPGALLTEQGPIPSAGASSESITLRNLRRVEAGIRGEHLESEIVMEGEVDLGKWVKNGVNGEVEGMREGDDGRLDRLLAESQAKLLAESNGAVEGDGDDGGEGDFGEDGEDEGWQDMESYQREQRDVDGEIGKRDNAVGEAGKVPKVKEVDEDGKKKRKRRDEGNGEIEKGPRSLDDADGERKKKRKKKDEGDVEMKGAKNGGSEEEGVPAGGKVDGRGQKAHKVRAGLDHKEDRKEAKKLRRKAEKRERAEKLAREKAAER